MSITSAPRLSTSSSSSSSAPAQQFESACAFCKASSAGYRSKVCTICHDEKTVTRACTATQMTRWFFDGEIDSYFAATGAADEGSGKSALVAPTPVSPPAAPVASKPAAPPFYSKLPPKLLRSRDFISRHKRRIE